MRTNTKFVTVAKLFIAACDPPPPASPTSDVATQAPAVPTQSGIAPSSTHKQPVATSSATALTPLDLTSDPEAIRQRMLHRHENWHSIWVQFYAVEIPPEGFNQLIHLARHQVWIRQPAEVLLLYGPVGDGDPDYIFLSNGTRFLEAELATGLTQEGDVPPSILEPFFPLEENTDTIFDCPPEGIVGNLVGEMICSAGIAQRRDTYELIGVDTISDRASLVVDFTPLLTILIIDKFCIDAFPGVLLQHQALDKKGGGERV